MSGFEREYILNGFEIGLICGLLVASLYIGIIAYLSGEKLRKRLNYMQEVLVKKGMVGEFDFTIALRGIKQYDVDDEDNYIT